MSRIDQFESVFRSAARELYDYEPVRPSRVLVITDLVPERARAYADRLAPFLSVLGTNEVVPIAGVDCATVDALLKVIEEHAPDLVVTYRCVHSPAWEWPYTIGDHIEVLTQVTDVPVLLLPRIDTGHATEAPLAPPRTVLAMTDHLAGDSRLVNWAVAFAGSEQLVLAHVEDSATFERYIKLIGKSPNLDTDIARRDLHDLILREPHDWVETCRRVLEAEAAKGATVPTIDEVIKLGHRLETYAEVVTSRAAELFVLNTKDDDQLAIHGLAYPLMVELRQIPMLLL